MDLLGGFVAMINYTTANQMPDKILKILPKNKHES